MIDAKSNRTRGCWTALFCHPAEVVGSTVIFSILDRMEVGGKKKKEKVAFFDTGSLR